MSEDLKKEVEALLFAAGRKIPIDEIVMLSKSEKNSVEKALKELKEEYTNKDSSLFLIEEGDGWKMSVRDKYIPLVKEVAPHTELNRSMLETLAVIAWKQPVMQSEVIKMRTSTAYEDIKLLLEMGFISKEKRGRSFIIKPTGRFFDYFDLPSKEKLREMFKEIGEAEVQKDAQTKIGEIETHPDNVGQLDTYESKESSPKEIQEGEEKIEGEHLGKLNVFDVPPSEEKDLDEEKNEEETETSESEEETTTQDNEESSEEKSQEAEEPDDQEEIETSENEEPEENNQEDKIPNPTTESIESVEETTQESKETQEEKPEEDSNNEHKISKELEEFAGTEEKLGEE